MVKIKMIASFSSQKKNLPTVASVILAVFASMPLANANPIIYAESVLDNPDGSFTVVAPMANLNDGGNGAVVLRPGDVETDVDSATRLDRYAMFADAYGDTANYVCNNLSPDRIVRKRSGHKNYGPFKATNIYFSKANAKELRSLVPEGEDDYSPLGIIQNQEVAKRMARSVEDEKLLQVAMSDKGKALSGLTYWNPPSSSTAPPPSAIYWVLCKPTRQSDRDRRKQATANVKTKDAWSLARFQGLQNYRKETDLGLFAGDSDEDEEVEESIDDQHVDTGYDSRNILAAASVLIDPSDFFKVVHTPSINIFSNDFFESPKEGIPSFKIHGFSTQSDPNGVCSFFKQDYFDGKEPEAGMVMPANLELAKLAPSGKPTEATENANWDAAKDGKYPFILKEEPSIRIGRKGHFYDESSDQGFFAHPLPIVDKKGEIIWIDEPERLPDSLVAKEPKPVITRIACMDRKSKNSKKREILITPKRGM